MTILDYYQNIYRQLSSLQSLRKKTITAEKYLGPIREIVRSWNGIKEALINGAPNEPNISKTDIIIADLATESGKERIPRLKLVRQLRNLKNCVYPFTLRKEISFVGSGLVIFQEKKEFTVYNYLKSQIGVAKNRVWIIDGYIGEGTLNILYGLPNNISIRILTKYPEKNFKSVWTKFINEYKKSEVRKHSQVHDRLIIVDNKSFMTGPSLKDAGKSPSLICHFDSGDSKKAVEFFEWFWGRGRTIK